MAQTVDARGLACPQPVILTRKALQEGGGPVTTIVDNDPAQRNVTRLAEKAGHTVTVEMRKGDIYLHIAGEARSPEPMPVGRAIPASGPLVLVVSSEFMGRGEHEELGRVLVRGFFHTLGEVEPIPDTIILINSGVKLVVEGSPVVEDLHALAACGVEILACGTCLDYYELMDKLAVGEVSNMYSIAEAILSAAKTVNL